MAEVGNRKIFVYITTPKDKKVIEVDKDCGIKQFKALVAEIFEVVPEQIVLNFAGKDMRDADTLQTYKINDGLTINLNIKAQTKSNETSQPADVEQAPFGEPDVEADMQFVQQMMSNPEVWHQLIISHPQMQILMQRIPLLSDVLNNSELFRQTMELARNLLMCQCIYHDTQQPMMNAVNPDLGDGNIEPSSNTAGASSDLPPSSVLNIPAMQTFWQQITENPSLIQDLFLAPDTLPMFDDVNQGTDNSSSFACPLFANYPHLQEQVRNTVRQFLANIQNPEVMNLFTNRETINAVMESVSHTHNETNISAVPNTALGSASDPKDNKEPTEVRTQSQLERLPAMDFRNHDATLEELIKLFADINAAMERQLSTNQ